eukprot:CAMPEP_0181425668 /NCGR_PEP_ID=MMETSP1110-20121109/15276_1 /TAXON_ID=174948 /ORGANISM="Symbiodinium sp., Strain CCMP421" /LENGTH=1604 /DNA_ID=CAMNT_0023548859 /DNA_START=40 /DNA_END=4854 /DNA_ORIENTATION=-
MVGCWQLCRSRGKQILFVAAALAVMRPTEASWVVRCNLDCDGVNSCEEKQVCSGQMVEEGTCPDQLPCAQESEFNCMPVDCQWSEWREWENDGISGLCTRKRYFSPPRCGGKQCLGTMADSMYCEPGAHAPKDCEFTDWEDWGSCSETTLQRTRQRGVAQEPSHGGAPCQGPLGTTEPCGDREPPAPCVLGEWMSWSGCTRECGGGQQFRVRAIAQEAAEGGKLCEGEDGRALVLQSTRPCNVDIVCDGETAKDCVLSHWGDWSVCDPDVPAHSRQRYRSRSIAIPGANGGAACTDSLQETLGCEESHVLPPVDCKLSAWSAWKLCDKTCEGGQTLRTRTVEVEAKRGGRPCQDSTLETMPCNEIPCQLDPEGRDCQLSLWTSWTDCSVSCGQGVRQRSREVLTAPLAGGRGCSAILQEVMGCSKPVCNAVDCVWDTWDSWSECSRTCDGGQKSRNRTIYMPPSPGGKPCRALDSISEIASCGTAPCSSASCQDGVWHDWGEWGQCSRACAGGVRWRHRKVASEALDCGTPAVGPAMDLQQCNDWPCEEDRDCIMSTWSHWSNCSASCYGEQKRKRHIVQQGSGSGSWCTDPDDSPAALEEMRPCNGPQEASDAKIKECGFGEVQDCLVGTWSSWSACTKTCNGGIHKRKRHIVRPSRLGGKPCNFTLEEVKGCGTETCGLAMDCEWDDWDQWGACTHCSGERIRVREIRHLGNELGKPCEPSSSREVSQCNNCPAKKTYWCVWAEWEEGACSATCGTGGRLRRQRMLQTLSSPPKNPADAVGNVTGAGSTCEAYEVDYTTCKGLPQDCTACVPQDCEFDDWMDWSQPTTCDGVCTRSRKISRLNNDCGKACTGNLKETKACVLPECEGTQECTFSHWSTWGGCSESSRQQTRLREIAVPSGPFGAPCTGPQKETKPCEASAEKQDCQLSEWSEWRECSKSCGGGQRSRSREIYQHAQHGGEPCTGSMRITEECGTEACGSGDPHQEPGTDDCLLSDWSDWGGCDGSTVQAYRTRHPVREAQEEGIPCSGTLKEAGPCPGTETRDCVFSEWGTWGGCGASCGGGQRFRTREILHPAKPGGEPCTGSTHETEVCNEEIACNVHLDCVVSHWSLWSVCSVSCGEGQNVRQRKIIQAVQPGGSGCNMALLEVGACTGSSTNETCGDKVDCVWGHWMEWSDCQEATFCGLGYRSRSRKIAVTPVGKGERCDPLPAEEVVTDLRCAKSCTKSAACVDGEWGEWGPFGSCSVTCGQGGTSKRTRSEKVKANHCGFPASGPSEEYGPCAASRACESEMGAQDCKFGAWSQWEECSASCNGARNRHREIIQYSAYGGQACEGPVVESERCNPSPSEHSPPYGCVSGAPVDCVQWPPSEWSECSAKCGTGNQTRERRVAVEPAYGGKSCPEPLKEIRECHADVSCEVVDRDCELSDWEDWSPCELIAYQKLRRRKVKISQAGIGKDCQGDLTEVKACGGQCQDRTYWCSWADWRQWGLCSTTCGSAGRRHRYRPMKLIEVTPAEMKLQGASNGTAAPKAPATPVLVSPAEVQEQFQLLSRKMELGHGHLDLLASFFAGVASVAGIAGLTVFVSRRGFSASLAAPLYASDSALE